MLFSKLHCQKDFNSILFIYRGAGVDTAMISGEAWRRKGFVASSRSIVVGTVGTPAARSSATCGGRL